jgi:DNA-directed RNA polymerase subunit F
MNDLKCQICGKDGENQHDLYGEVLCFDCACEVRKRLADAIPETIREIKRDLESKRWVEGKVQEILSVVQRITAR